MPNGLLILCIAVLGVLGWLLRLGAARRSVKGQQAQLHSRPHYHGASVLLWTVLPALALVLTWFVAEPLVIDSAVYRSLPEQSRPSRRRCGR